MQNRNTGNLVFVDLCEFPFRIILLKLSAYPFAPSVKTGSDMEIKKPNISLFTEGYKNKTSGRS